MRRMCVIGLNTAIEPYAFAILDGDAILDSVLTSVTYAVSENIMVEVEDRLKRLSKSWNDVDAVYVVDGPGSYTGLRIGVSFVKTLGMVRDIPVYGVDALTVLASQVLRQKGVAMAVVGARKNEYNIQLFSGASGRVHPLCPMTSFSHDDLCQVLSRFEEPIYVVGQVGKLKKEASNESCLVFIESPVRGEAVVSARIASPKTEYDDRGDYRRIMPKYSHLPVIIK